jgi:ketosteroid isomerase-like protein
MNRCWTTEWDEKEFRKYIHADAVAIVPTSPGRLDGQDAYVAGWKGFVELVRIHEWKETDHRIQIYASGRAAVVTYFFRLTFETGGRVQTIMGRDMFFLIKEARRWLVVADQFSPEPSVCLTGE